MMPISTTRASALALILGILLPIPQQFVGEWTVRVSDYDDRPISGALVWQSWENYTYNVAGNQNLYTDAQGKVVFAMRRKIRPVAYWVGKAVANVVGFGVHAGFGTVGQVWVADIPSLDPERKQRFAHNQKVTDALGTNCGERCNVDEIESKLRIPLP